MYNKPKHFSTHFKGCIFVLFLLQFGEKVKVDDCNSAFCDEDSRDMEQVEECNIDPKTCKEGFVLRDRANECCKCEPG